MTGIILFLIILNFLIVVHELGHYVAAKRVGVVVKEFAVGLGPILLKREWNGTLWTLRLIPIGGYNALKGENEEEGGEGNFSNARKLHKLEVLFAGSLMNILIAVILFFLLIATNNWKMNLEIPPSTIIGGQLVTSPNAGQPRIVALAETSALFDKGLKLPLVIHKIGDITPTTAEEVSTTIKKVAESGQKELKLVFSEGGSTELKEINVAFNSEGKLGVQLVDQFSIDYSSNILTKLFSGVSHSINTTLFVFEYFSNLISYTFTTRDVTPALYAVSGPTGVYVVVNDKAQSSLSLIRDVANITALVSLNLGIFNLLPFPALDGWHILITVLEKLRRRSFNKEMIGRVTFIGFMLLLLLSLLITIKDLIIFF